MTNVSNHTSHTDGTLSHGLDRQTLANGVLVWECMLSQNLIDYDNRLSIQAIVVIEESALAQRNTHDLQIIRRHAGCQRNRHFIRRGRRGGSPIAETIFANTHRDNVA